jgi:sigma-B regulation protein RsbQ
MVGFCCLQRHTSNRTRGFQGDDSLTSASHTRDRPLTADEIVARNNVTIGGREGAPAIVFVHGFGCDQGMYSRLLPYFTDDYRTVLFDHVGSGGSNLDSYDPVQYGSLDRYAADLLEIIDALELRDVTLVAHSVGAMMAFLAAVQRPDAFAHLVLLAPSPSYIDDPAAGYVGGLSADDVQELLGALDENHMNWAATMAPVVMGAENDGELVDELEGNFCRVDPRVMRTFARVTFLSDVRAVLPDVTVPTLIVQCTNDALAPLAVGRYLYERLTDSELVVLPTTGHVPQVSAPGETAAAILGYIAATT